METNIQTKLEELNQLYHDIITANPRRGVDRLKMLARGLKDSGYRFKIGTPDVDFSTYTLGVYETLLLERLKLMQSEKQSGVRAELFMYAHYMRECEHYLRREILVALCKKGAIDKMYFQDTGSDSWIDFCQSGHFIDAFILEG